MKRTKRDDTIQKVMVKLAELENKLIDLKNIDYTVGEKERIHIKNLLERIIDRFYPKDDAKNLKTKLTPVMVLVEGVHTFKQGQLDYIANIDRLLDVIKLIKGEGELFEFSDFKPIKEETEWQLGSDKLLGYIKKKRTEER